MSRSSLLVLALLGSIAAPAFAQAPVNIRAIYLDEDFNSPIDLVQSLEGAANDQWVSVSHDGRSHFTQLNVALACFRGGYMAIPRGGEICPAASLYSPRLSLPDCVTQIEITFKRRFSRSEGKQGDLQIGFLDEAGQFQLAKIAALTTSKQEDCELVTVIAEGVDPNIRLVLQGPSLCSGMAIDDLLVRSVPIESRVLTPTEDSIDVSRGSSVVFSAEAESYLDQVSFAWGVRKLDANDEPHFFQGQEVTIPFNKNGLYEVLLLASDGCAADITPPRVEVWVRDTVTRITAPETERRLPLILTELPSAQAFAGVVEDPNALVHSIRWLAGNKVVCAEDVTPGFASRQVACEIPFTERVRTSVALQSLDASGQVIGEDTQVVWVAPELKAVVVSPHRELQFGIDEVVNLVGTVVGSHANDPDNQYAWLVGGHLYEGKVVAFEPSRHGAYSAKFVVRNERLKLGDEATVSFFVNDPDHHPIPFIVHPRTDWTLPPGGVMFFEASYGDVPPDQRSLYWEIVEEATGEVLDSAERPVLGKVAFPHVGIYVARLFLRGGETERLVDSRTLTVAEAAPGARAPESARPIGNGRYTGLQLDQEHYFQAKVSEPGQVITVSMDFGDGAQMIFFPPSGEPMVLCKNGPYTIQLAGLPVGDYTWGVLPGGPCVPASKQDNKAGFSFSIRVLAPALYFSDVVENKDYSTFVGVVNPNNEEAEITVLGYDANGNILCQASSVIEPMGAFRDSAANLFGAKAKDVVWCRVDSTVSLVGFSRSVSLDQTQAYSVSAANLLQPELYVPHIAEDTNTWSTQARVVNGQDTSIASKMVTRGQSQPLENAGSFSKDNVDFLSRLGGSIEPEDNWAEFRDENYAPTLAGNEIFGTVDGSNQIVGLGLAGSVADNPNFTTASGNIYFTHITSSADFWTGLALVNRGDSPQSAQIKAYGAGGVLTGSGLLTLQGGQKLVSLAAELLSSVGITSTDVAWIEVTADANVSGYELFGALTGGKRLAGIEGITEIRKSLCIPFVDNTGAFWHGVALVNVTNSANALTLKLRSESGEVLAQSTDQVLAAKEKRIFTIESLFGIIPANGAWVEVTGSGELVGFEIFGDWTNEHMSGVIAQ